MIETDIKRLIKARRAVYPAQYKDIPISDEIILEILESAKWAPTHKLTQPWRFKILKEESLKKFGVFMAEKYRSLNHLESFSITKYDKLKKNPQRAGAVFAICMQRDPDNRVPEWEEVAAVAMAVQNMWLTCTTYGIGCYWSSPDLLQYFGEFHPLSKGERCLGLFYMGYADFPAKAPPRKPLEDYIAWIK